MNQITIVFLKIKNRKKHELHSNTHSFHSGKFFKYKKQTDNMTLDTLLGGALTKYFREHLEATDVPQTYDQHKNFAVANSWKIIKAGIRGIIHGYWPNAFPFDTSTAIIYSSKKLIDSGRHRKELNEVMPGYINSEYLDKKISYKAIAESSDFLKE